MKKIYNIPKIRIVYLIAILVAATTMNLHAQNCSQVEILYQAPECLEKHHQGSAGLGGSSCIEIAVCVNQPYTYSSSATTGYTFNWTVTGPTAVVINPNNTSAVVNIVWPQVGVFTLTLTATDGSGNVFTYCLKVNVKDRPVANFTFSPNNVCAGSTIAFTNSSTYSGGGMGYSWDFGDPASGGNNFSTTTNPVHIYNAVGVYTVTLIAYSLASSGGGTGGPDHPSIMACCADTFTLQVNIIPGSLTIECISTVCAGDTGTYTAVGCVNPVWLPPVGGTFLSPPTGNTVRIIWGNGNPQGQILAQCPGGCIATVSVPIIPSIPVILGNAKPCFNSTTSYTLPVLPGTFYNWTLNNISNATNYNSLLNTYPDNNTVSINWGMAPPGTYHLIINLVNKHICCNSTALLVINPTQAWQAFADQTVCTGPPGASLFAFPAAGTYKWTVLAPNAGVAPLTGTGPTFNPVFSNTGNYTIEVIDTGNNYCNSGIANPQQIQVTVVGTPAPGIINGPDTVCAGSDYSYSMSTNAPSGYHYEWSITGGAGSFQPGNLTTTNGNSATILWTALTGTISVALQRNGTPACPRPVTLTVVQATVGSISGPLNVCVDGTGSYTLSGGTLPAGEVITWSLAPPFSSMGTIISGQGTNSITVLWHGQPGTGPWGPVTINASTGCGNATALSGIMIFPKFTFSITKTGIDICQGSGVNLAVTGAPSGSTYLWNTGATTAGIINITTAGTYDVTVTKGGCSFNKQYLVPDPFEIAPVTCGVGICDANDSTNQLLGVTIIKPLAGTFTYQWYTDTFPGGTLIPGATLPNYTTPTHGKYYVIVTYGNCSKHLGFTVSKVCCPDVNLPKITSVVRNTCNSYTFTGTTPNPFGAPITWYWGDGTQDSGASGVPITHVYTLAGEYCVTFCVGPPSPNTTNCSGNCVATNVTVPIEAAFLYTLGCNGCLSVSNASIAITNNPAFVTYFWDFGDGDTSVAQNPGIHCYALPGTYVVTLTVTYNDSIVTCTKTATHTVNYTTLGINISPMPVCTGVASVYSSTPGSFVSYTWNFGDGFTAYTPSSTHIYNLPGLYPVSLSVIDQLGNTCTANDSINVLPGIGPCSIQPAFMCPGGTALLSTPNIAGYTYLWEVETSPNIFAPAPGVNTNNTYTVTTPGFYRVNITGVNGCGCTTKKVEVKLMPKPQAIIAVAPSAAICGSGNITLTSVNHLSGDTSDWYSGGNYGNLLSSGQMHFEFGVTSTTIYNLVLTNEYGCSDTCSFAVTVNPVPAPPVITSSPGLCEGVPITLTVTNYSTDITWNSGSATTSIIVTSAGTYTATYTDSLTGCSSSTAITINRRPPVDLFPHYCDSIPCTCRNPQGDFTIYAPKPLIGAFAATYDIQWYFNNIPVGTNGPNPFFTPAVTGTYHIVVTDPITGCSDTSKTYSVVVALCNQCDSTTCHVDLGNDTTICAGSTVTLTASGCNGTATWYELTMNGPVPVGNGPLIDVSPLQSTCYVVQCCDSFPDEINEGGFFLCCCTDTICIIVNPVPTVSWPVMFPPVCLNSDSIYLDTLIIALPPGGTGGFSGVGVVGNYFHPDSLGFFTITYCYTDTNGCTSCVTNFINVIFCCDSTTCQVDIGNDTTICAGGVVILTAQGCSGTVTWYMLGPGGPVPVGQGPIFDAFPQGNTCYVAECCDNIPDPINVGFNVCCCTDTICINVNPLPSVSWPVMFPPVCLNSDSVYLDTLNIIALPPGGTGVFSGPGVVGNYFHPTTLGFHTITYCYTDINGCITCVSNFINVIFCCDSTTCHVDIGNDTTICAGGVVILTAQGCNGSVKWYELGPNGPVQVGQGPIFDAFPMVSKCYVAECCDTIPDPINGGFYVCCCTDTICINVNPLPQVSWPVMFPPVCLNSDSVYLDTLNIIALPPGGTGVFSGPGVVGNYFHPTTLGFQTITYCYTDINGCTTCVTNFINVIFCCDSTTCHVDIGNDTTICAGGVVILTAQGCNGSVKWYKLGPDGPVQVGQGPIYDAFPLVSTCYVAECCDTIPDIGNGGFNVCCCTDTICITVNPLPILQWPVQYASVCLNSDSIYLDTANIFVFVNNNWLPVAAAGGTGIFVGQGVIGNYFHPTTLGPQTITYYYTDSLGCTGSVSITINVIFCCGTSCHVDAGNDTTICAGTTVTMNAQGCSGTATWYELGVEGPVVIGDGGIVDVHPQVSTCYVVICCCQVGPVLCCDTDTICITVRPVPHLDWPVQYQDVCLNSDSVFLDPANVFVTINNTWVSVTSTNGTWYFSGTGVIGNYFHPTTFGLNVITVFYTDTNGCTGSVTTVINVINCGCNAITCDCNDPEYLDFPTITILSIDPDDCNQTGCIHAVFTGCCLTYSFTYYDPCRPELSYSIAPTSDSSIFCNLRAGTYTLYVMDPCGNYVSTNVTVPLINGPLTASVNYSNCGSRICVNAEGGCPPYTYNWLGGNTGPCVFNYPPCTSTYVTITDSRGCSVIIDVIVPQIAFTNVVQPSCCASNGSLCVNACFGPLPYTYSWSNGATTQCISSLAPGTYCVTITDRNGNHVNCCYTLTGAILTPPPVTFHFNNCGSSVQAVLGETNCQNFTYHWENNSHELVRNNLEGCDSLTFTIVLCNGSVYHHGFRVPHIYPTISPVNCLTGLGTICVPIECFRCGPYIYTWTGIGQSQTTTSPCVSVPPGAYTVCITNSCGDVFCCQVYLPPPIPIHVDITHTNVSCYGFHDGTVTISASGGTAPYTGTGTYTGLGAGTYSYTVTDSSGCSATVVVTITQPPPLIITDFYPFGCPGVIISISGSGFTGATGVLFNGSSAAGFVVHNDALIEAEVPVGATSGPITVIHFPCSVISANPFTVTACPDVITLNMDVFLQGYYTNAGSQTPMDNAGGGGCLYIDAGIEGFSADFNDVDSIFISLVDSAILGSTGDIVSATVETSSGILHTDGSLEVLFSASTLGNSYYLKVEQRNHIETWSAQTVLMNTVTEYDFTDSYLKAYELDGNPFHAMKEVEQGKWAIYAADLYKDGYVDILDIPVLTAQIDGIFPFGYQSGDLNGDGFIDILDIPILTNNIDNGIYSQHP